MAVVKLASSTQESMSESLLRELHEVVAKPEYNQMQLAPLYGVIEMFKMQQYERNLL